METVAALRAFVTVAESHSFTDAGRKLGLSTSAVSRLVSCLEAQHKAQLLRRSTRHVSLTAAGEQCLSLGRKALDSLDCLERAMSLSMHTEAPSLRIAVSPTLATTILGQATSDFKAANCDALLELSTEDPTTTADLHKVDGAIRCGALPDSGLFYRELGYLQYRVYASSTYLERHGEPRTPDDLRHHRAVDAWRGVDERAAKWDFKMSSDSPVTQTVPLAVRVTDAHTASQTALSGVGLVRLPVPLHEEDPNVGRLVEVLRCFRPSPVVVTAVALETFSRLPLLQSFTDSVSRTLERGHMEPHPQRDSQSRWPAFGSRVDRKKGRLTQAEMASET